MKELPKQNLVNPIEADGIDEHRERLHEELSGIQLWLADRIYQQQNGESKKNFTDILKDINCYLIGSLNQIIAVENGGHLDEEEQQRLLDNHLAKIDQIHAQIQRQPEGPNLYQNFLKRHNKLMPIFGYIRDLKFDSKRGFPDNWVKAEREDAAGVGIDRAGILTCKAASLENRNCFDDELLQRFREEGFAGHEDILLFQLPDIYTSGKEFNSEILGKSWGKLAELILDYHPQTAAIVASSWLFDHPVFKETMKFKKIKESGRYNWGQMIDQKGQIKTKRLMSLIETGELPFKDYWGYIKTEDFLRQSLPADKKGEIILKQLNPEWLDKHGSDDVKLDQSGKEFKTKWQSGQIGSEADLRAVLNQMAEFKEFLENSGLFNDFFEVFKNNIGQSLTSIRQNNLELMEKINQAHLHYLATRNKDKYIDKIVTID